MFNNEYFIHELAEQGEDRTSEPSCPTGRERLKSDYCLPLRLPPKRVLEREGKKSGPLEELRQLRRSPTPPLEDESFEHVPESPHPQRQRTLSQSSTIKANKKLQPFKEPPGFQILRAVETKDIMFLMEVRDRAFHLLLRKTGDVTPLLHAMRIGNSHRDIAILILGALSRWVNHLDDTDMQNNQTKVLLKVLRTNLRLAIDYGLQQSQSDLSASFMQTLVMSEGDKWVHGSCSSVTTALRLGPDGKPVSVADGLVRKFATRELGKADLIASLEEYIANATGDLVVMAIWLLVTEKIGGDPIPTYCFARDQRVFKAFEDRMNENRTKVPSLSRRLRWQIRVALKVFEGRAESYRRKVELATQELDGGVNI